MLFQTPEFAILFVVTLAGFYLLAPRFRLWVLGSASLLFYAASGLLDFTLLFGTILFSYYLSKQVRKDGSRWPIFAGVVLLLASLAYFKYGEFVYDSVRTLVGDDSWLDRPDYLATILPLGISFYTFQVIGYLIDLRRGRAVGSVLFRQFQLEMETLKLLGDPGHDQANQPLANIWVACE